MDYCFLLLIADCPPKTFKDVPGNFQCKICGANVIEGKLPRASVCECVDGFYRPTAFVSSYAVNCEGTYYLLKESFTQLRCVLPS